MKIVFAHDHIFYMYKNKMYSTGGLSKEILDRYTSIFGEVAVISRKRDLVEVDDKLSIASTDNVRFISVPDFKTLKKHISLRNIKSIVNEEVSKCDAVIARLPSSIGNIAVDAAIKYSKPYLIEVVACPWDAYWNHSLIGKFVAPFMYYSTKESVKDAKYVIYVTSEFLQRRYPCNGKSIACSDVSLPPLDNCILENRIIKIEQMSPKKPIILGTTAAIDVRYKGQQYVIKAISKLNKEGYNFEYHLAGGGDKSYLMNIAGKYNVIDNVKFLGTIPHEKVFKYLDEIDIYIQPSKQEGLPRALVEAISRGCPALGSTTGGIPELLDKEFIFHNGAVNEICNLLTKMNKSTMLRQANRSFEKSKEFDEKILNKKREDFYVEFSELLKNKD